jgi:hypothetical protein
VGFQPLDEFFDPTLRLPIRGKTYVVPSPSAQDGLFVMQLVTIAERQRAGEHLDSASLESLHLDDKDEQSLYERLLGPALPEMVADGVPWEMVQHAGMTAFIWVSGSREAAEKFWATPAGEALAPNRAARRATATSTRSPASTAGTTSRKRRNKKA